jgi:very-short-patch-repair endonuclease
LSTDLARRLRNNPTPPERAMWRLLWPLRQSGWHFRRQVQLGPYYVDFACLGASLVIEVDGDTHGTDAGRAADTTRGTYMASRNLLVLRFTNRDVLQNPAGVFSEITGVLKAAAATGNTPTPSLPARGREQRRERRAKSSQSSPRNESKIEGSA